MGELYGWVICDELLNSAHTLIAGTTGSGKSVLMNSMIVTALSSCDYFFLIDLKRVELSRYKTTRSCLDMVTEPEDVVPLLDNVIYIMECRYTEMEKRSLVKTEEPRIYIFIDELADLVNDKEALKRLVKIGRLGRAADIHIVGASQDPSRRTLCAQLMQNFTCCVALRCKTAIESRQIIGRPGAEMLPEHGKAIVSDSHGVKQITVPLTPDEDIRAMIESRQPEPTIPQKISKAVTDTFTKNGQEPIKSLLRRTLESILNRLSD